MKNVFFIAVFGMLYSVAAFAQSEEVLGNKISSDNDVAGMHFEYFDNWTMKNTPSVMLFIDDFESSIDLVATPMKGSVEDELKLAKEIFSDADFVETTFNGYKAYKFGEPLNYGYYIFRNNIVYFIMVMCEPDRLKEAEAILNSIKID